MPHPNSGGVEVAKARMLAKSRPGRVAPMNRLKGDFAEAWISAQEFRLGLHLRGAGLSSVVPLRLMVRYPDEKE